jgi:glycosyltransferase involved in cell wall biosynthesis
MDRFKPRGGFLQRVLPEIPITLGMVARYNPDLKGHHFLIEVLASHPLRDRFRVTFAGAGCDTAPELRQHLERAGLLSQTTLHGAVADVERLYAGFDILVLPSRSEALPLTLIEAAAMGVVVCASRVGDVPSIGFAEELLFEPRDAAECARALSAAVELARMPGTAKRLRELVAERFSIDRIARLYADLYRDLVGQV